MLLQNPARAPVQKLLPSETSENQFAKLCTWIDDHLGETIGWQQLIEYSDLDYQTIQTLFFKYASTTPMTWIRNRRKEKTAVIERTRPILTLAKWKPEQSKVA
jgi:transcriptional regulator GlxA family with amidase domain